MKFLLVICALLALACAEVDLQKSFALVDANGDGYVSKAEFDALYNKFDDDGDSQISATEFVKHFMMTNMTEKGSLYVFFRIDVNNNLMVNQTEIDQMFGVFDANQDMSVDFDEYASVMNALMLQLQIAASGQQGLAALFNSTDGDGDGMLTADEFWAMLSPADKDGNNMISGDEFVTYWRSVTGDNEERSRTLFSILDFDMDGEFGSQQERTAFFTGFDYGNDGKVDMDEFLNSMLNLFARVMNKLSMARMKKMNMMTMFNSKKAFDMIDANMDGMISMDEQKSVANMSDTDGDKMLSYKEYVTTSMKAGFDQTTSLFMFFLTDVNHDDMIDHQEMEKSFHHKDRNMDKMISMDEFNNHLDMIQHAMSVARRAGAFLSNMLAVADVNGDEMLTPEEFVSIVSDADLDDNMELTKKEFVPFWSQHTGLEHDISARLFDNFDADMDGVIKTAERPAIFKGFDYGNDGKISFEEYNNAMLWNFAKIVRAKKMDVMMHLWGSFNMTEHFHHVDKNGDGSIQRSEFDAAYTAMDTNMNKEWDATEYINTYKPEGMHYQGALYLFFLVDDNQDQKVVPSELEAVFNQLDMNGDKDISSSEYMTAWHMLRHQMSDAALAGYRLSKIYKMVDMDHNGNLTTTEMDMIFTHADQDKDGLVSEDEFVMFWMKKVGEPRNRAKFTFSYLDGDNDGFFGNDQEKQQLFDGFDYGDDNLVSLEEFLNGNLNLYSRAVKDEIEAEKMKKAADAVVGFFF